MLMLLIAAAIAQDDAAAMMRAAGSKLSTACVKDCAPPASARYRIAGETDQAPTAKDRAMRADGTRCQVVGARLCTSNGRKLFSTPLGD